MNKKALIIALSLATLVIVPILALSVNDCNDAWTQSAAVNTCNVIEIRVVNNNRCEVNANCMHPNGQYVVTTYTSGTTDPVSDVKALNNCGGTLMSGSCP